MKNFIKTLLLVAVLLIATNVKSQDVYTWPTVTLTTDSVAASTYLTYPSGLKQNYVGYLTVYVDTLTYVDSMLVIHQTQVSIDNSVWFDYGAADTLINYSDAAEKYEDYEYLNTPFNYIREKFTQNDSCSSTILGKFTIKKRN